MMEQPFLRKIALFKNLDDRQLELILGLVKEVSYEAGQKVIEEGNVGNALYIITKGKVRISRAFGQETVILTEMGPYDFFGEMALIDDFSASATVTTLEPTTLLVLVREDFKTLLSTSSEISSKLWESLARNLNMKIRKTDDLVKMYHGLSKALCENEQFRELYTSWNYSLRKE